MHKEDDDQPAQRNLAELLEAKRFLDKHIASLSNELSQVCLYRSESRC